MAGGRMQGEGNRDKYLRKNQSKFHYINHFTMVSFDSVLCFSFSVSCCRAWCGSGWIGRAEQGQGKVVMERQIGSPVLAAVWTLFCGTWRERKGWYLLLLKERGGWVCGVRLWNVICCAIPL